MSNSALRRCLLMVRKRRVKIADDVKALDVLAHQVAERQKVAEQLLKFFKTDDDARVWFLKQ